MALELTDQSTIASQRRSGSPDSIPWRVADDESDDDIDTDRFRFCCEYLYGIKSTKIWATSIEDRTKSMTYFILPETPANYCLFEYYATYAVIKPTLDDFGRFWFDELSDMHKDRYVLVNYMAAYNDELRRRAIENNDDPFDAPSVDVLSIEKFSQIAQSIRKLVMEKNEHALSLLVNGHSDFDIIHDELVIVQRMRPTYNLRMKTLSNEPLEHDRRWSTWFSMLSRVLSGFVNTYFVWVSYDGQNVQRYANVLRSAGVRIVERLDTRPRLDDQIEFVRKLNMAAPRWSQADRRMIWDAIETDGKSGPGTYVQTLLNEVGVEKFKTLVFGKQRFCEHCGRSSYTGDDRLLACKRCDTEHIRPRAWYCDRECQKADWRRHKASKHPPTMVVVEQKAAGKKKRRRKRRKRTGRKSVEFVQI